jgi:quercetin dioxygenase-like cupin family protein
MKINRLSDATSNPAPEDWFTGNVWMEPLGSLPDPRSTQVLRVTFSPGARTAWHRHPDGQVLHVLDGVARIGREGEPVREANAGDSVEFAAGERHWHGAGPGRLMSHVAIQGSDPAAQWEEHVSDADYDALG